MSVAAPSPRENLILGVLPPAALERVTSHLEPYAFANGDIVVEAGDALDSVFFPAGMVVSFDQVVTDSCDEPGTTPGVALTGSEGVVGVELFLGGMTAINRATVRMQGAAFRMRAAALREEFARGGALQRQLLRAADALLAQISATAACERLHSTSQRVIRWLLISHDRAGGKDLMWTQDSLAHLLGVRRESVSIAARNLQNAGLIKYQRGSIIIVDRLRLEAGACNCYREIKSRYALLNREDD